MNKILAREELLQMHPECTYVPELGRGRASGRTWRCLWRALLEASHSDGRRVIVLVNDPRPMSLRLADWTYNRLSDATCMLGQVKRFSSERRIVLPNGGIVAVEPISYDTVRRYRGVRIDVIVEDPA